MAGAPNDYRPPPPRQDQANPLDPWGVWIVRWYGATLAVSIVATMTVLGSDTTGWHPGAIVLFALPISFLVAALTLFASGSRWLLARFTPPLPQGGLLPAICLGVLAGAVPLWLLLVSDSITSLTSLDSRDLRISFRMSFPAGVGGGVASYLAERQVTVRGWVWWLTTIAAGLAAGTVSAWVRA